MKAVEQFGYGTAQECMRWVDVPIPTPGPNQVLVKSEYVGIRWGDIMGRTGDPYWRFGPPPFNKLVGAESAGTIEAIGSNVTNVKVGDRVFAACAEGYAEYVVADSDKLTPIPDHVLETLHRGRLADNGRMEELLGFAADTTTVDVVDQLYRWPSVIHTPARRQVA